MPEYSVPQQQPQPPPPSQGPLKAQEPQLAPLPNPPTASDGLHPMRVSPEEGLFAVPQEQVVKHLNKVLRLKYTAHLAYMNYGDRLRAHWRDSVAGHFGDHMKDEREDAYVIVRKITALGGEPLAKIATIPDTPDLHQMLMFLLDHEKQLVQAARELAAMAGENVALKALGEQLALTDNHHADDMRRLMPCGCP